MLVLVADDEQPIAALVAAVVEDMGYEVQIAVNGRHALELARATWPSLVITDLMMPQLTGAGLIAALRAEARATSRRQIPVILMTAAGADHARETVADAVLSKPFDLEQLEAIVLRFLHDRAMGTDPGAASQ